MNHDPSFVIDNWLYQVEQTRADSTHDLYKIVMEQLYDYAGDPATWTDKTITEFLHWCVERGNSAITRNGKLRVIRTFLSDTGMDLQVPKAVPIRPSSPVAATEQETDLLVRHLPGNYKLALLLMADAGLTHGEVRKLRWRDISDDSILVHGPVNKERTIPIITKRLGQAARTNRAAGDEFVVPGRRGRMLARGYINCQLRKAAAEAGIDRILSARSFRHRFVARAVRTGVSAKAIQQVLGHSSLATTDRYLAALDGDQDFVRRSFERFGEPGAPDTSRN